MDSWLVQETLDYETGQMVVTQTGERFRVVDVGTDNIRVVRCAELDPLRPHLIDLFDEAET